MDFLKNNTMIIVIVVLLTMLVVFLALRQKQIAKQVNKATSSLESMFTGIKLASGKTELPEIITWYSSVASEEQKAKFKWILKIIQASIDKGHTIDEQIDEEVKWLKNKLWRTKLWVK